MSNASHRNGWRCVLLIIAAWTHPCCAEDAPQFSTPGSLQERGRFEERDGASLYRAICQGCHMPDAHGAHGAGMYPALASNPKLASGAYPAAIVLAGRHGMPSFADSLSDQQVADVVNYVRSHFDNHHIDELRSADVARLRVSLMASDPPH